MRFGSSGSWKASLEVIASSMPGRSAGKVGRPPVAMRTLSAVIGLAIGRRGDRVRILQVRPLRMDEVGAGVTQIGYIDARQPGDLDVLGLEELRPVEGSLPHRPAEARRRLEMVRKFAGVDHEFLGHAATNDAGAADPVFLGHGDTRSVERRQATGPHATGAGPDDKQVVVVFWPQRASFVSRIERRDA